MNKNLKKVVMGLYKPPFRYDDMGQIIFDANNNIVVDVRGWGRIKGMKNASDLQDELGRQIALGLTEHWGGAKNQDFQELEPEDLIAKLQKEIGGLGFSLRAMNCCKNQEIKIVRDLVERSEDELRFECHFGPKSVKEIKKVLGGMGLNLGMKIIGPYT